MNPNERERLVVSLSDTIEAWLYKMIDAGMALPYLGQATNRCMALAALVVLEAVDDVRESLVIDGEIKDE